MRTKPTKAIWTTACQLGADAIVRCQWARIYTHSDRKCIVGAATKARDVPDTRCRIAIVPLRRHWVRVRYGRYVISRAYAPSAMPAVSGQSASGPYASNPLLKGAPISVTAGEVGSSLYAGLIVRPNAHTGVWLCRTLIGQENFADPN